MKVEFIDNNRAWSFCPQHKDTKRPNLSITLKGRHAGRYKCWACGFSGKLTKAQIKDLDIDQYVSYDYSKWPQYSIVFYDLVTNYHKELKKFPLISTAFLKDLDISKGMIDCFNIGYDGSAYTIPMYNHYNEVTGIQRRFPNGSKCCVPHSKLGVFKPEHIETLDEEGRYIPNNIVFICEGSSDTLAVSNLGFNAIGRPYCHYDMEQWKFWPFFGMFPKIVIIPDTDKIGLKSAMKLKQNLIQLSLTNPIFSDCKPVNIKLLEFTGAKDIRDCIRIKGKDYVFNKLKECEDC